MFSMLKISPLGTCLICLRVNQPLLRSKNFVTLSRTVVFQLIDPLSPIGEFLQSF